MRRRVRSLGALAYGATLIILLACSGRPGGPVTLNVTAPQPPPSDPAVSGATSPVTLRWVRHGADTSRRAGERDAAFGIDMGDVYFANDPAGILEETVVGALRAGGHELVETSNVVIVGDYELFSVRTKTTPLYWDVVATIRTTLHLEGSPQTERRVYTVERSKRTYKWPSKEIMEQVVADALTELQRQIQADAELKTAIARRRAA
jgi:uncharacterized lipoprotein YajG